MNACDRDDAPLILLMNKRNLNCVKAELVHTFLSVSERPSLQDIFSSEMFHSLEIFIKFLEKVSEQVITLAQCFWNFLRYMFLEKRL